MATIQATDYAVDYIPGSSTTVKFNINQMEDLQTLFAGVVPTITQDRPTAAEMIK
ncbi:hypothetical protein FACS1894166_11570 [Bacilli bacterium]|nr:hypothetical protein FACS1894166_11570 [Bacilli bacterium]